MHSRDPNVPAKAASVTYVSSSPDTDALLANSLPKQLEIASLSSLSNGETISYARQSSQLQTHKAVRRATVRLHTTA